MGAMMCIQIINLQISIVAKKLKTKEKIKIQDEDLGFHPLARDKSYMATLVLAKVLTSKESM